MNNMRIRILRLKPKNHRHQRMILIQDQRIQTIHQLLNVAVLEVLGATHMKALFLLAVDQVDILIRLLEVDRTELVTLLSEFKCAV